MARNRAASPNILWQSLDPLLFSRQVQRVLSVLLCAQGGDPQLDRGQHRASGVGEEKATAYMEARTAGAARTASTLGDAPSVLCSPKPSLHRKIYTGQDRKGAG
jgi:hypothetical protein